MPLKLPLCLLRVNSRAPTRFRNIQLHTFYG